MRRLLLEGLANVCNPGTSTYSQPCRSPRKLVQVREPVYNRLALIPTWIHP